MFCIKCGKKLNQVDTDGFNYNTGERNSKLVCPTGLCEHTGVKHKLARRRWYQFGDEYCVKCNELFWYDYGI